MSGDGGEVMLPDDQQPTKTDDQSSIAEDTEGSFYIDPRRQHRPRLPEVHYDDGKTPIVGWIDPNNRAHIFHSCYEKGHITPQRSLKLFQVEKVGEDMTIC